ncbi:calcium/calmodulin-regulated receptor-like kinase 1 [Physcomitrium patens]|uniref:non-specific serine/threonine protein kinase n=1 Tax=Physcomitrium patens TaxID=3218 RepID=A0A2K1KIT1_PHYPA|nr:L-type lectin-domain containing receptor kinase S.4-like [Physcomitrium patens]PNR53687.1 hypothetical protein PHYPA_007362 [Physcomitrium patens]|eukprot:XP_024375549.1 L-type lectin-domain containing receptor kinase S.4-like [Physcomitrella patens]
MVNMRAIRLMQSRGRETVNRVLPGKKRWIVVAALLAGCISLAIVLETFSEGGIRKSFLSIVVHAASCSSTYQLPEDTSIPETLSDSCSKVVCQFHIAHRVFITLRSDNTVSVNIFCLSQVLLIISLAVVLIVFFQLTVVAIYVLRLYFRYSPSGENTVLEDEEEDSLPSTSSIQDCVAYSYKQLEKASNGFADKIGEGSFGTVYKGMLAHDGRESRPVAIKMMRHMTIDEGEIRRIGMLRHKHVLQLLGWSDLNTLEGRPLLMVTPLHSSLAKHLEDPDLKWLNWEARFKIAVGVAEGLAYLHDGLLQKLVHHDIKLGNILFDVETMHAYIADFGSAKFMEDNLDQVETRQFHGTTGYIDPHFRDSKIRSTKIDVYSFGVVLFVLAAGLKTLPIPQLVIQAKDEDIYDPKFLEDASFNREQLSRILRIARYCTRYNPAERPTLSQIVMMLRNDISVFPLVQDLSRAASCVATAFSKLKSFSPRYPAVGDRGKVE